jgi:uncharacterized repeat protein (TIGR03803 family)
MALLILSLAPVAWCGAKIKVLHNFGAASDGTEPNGPLVVDSNGNLYGVTFGGPGEYAYGLVFKLTPQKNGSWSETILHAFAGGVDGAFPWGGLLLDRSGNLYGTLQGDVGGAAQGVFELTPSLRGWTNNLLYTENAGPGLLFDSLGNLFGEIGSGESYSGAIGELSPGASGWTYTQLYSFCGQNGCPGGWNPFYPPTWDHQGNLWGTTWEGGIGRPTCADDAGGCGVIYAMTPNGDGTWTYHVLHRFASSPGDGQHPVAGLTIDAAGNFYGTTEDGGPYGYGTIFKFAYRNGKWRANLLYDFADPHQGLYPEGTLALDEAGNLYGMAQGGPNSCGGLSCGVVYRLAPQSNGTWKYTVLVNLSETTGGVLPFYSLTLDGKGHMFGVTSSFGQYGQGTAFEITQ